MNQAGTVVEELDDWESAVFFSCPKDGNKRPVILGPLTRGAWDFPARGTSPHLVNPYCDGLLVGRDVRCGAEQLGLGRLNPTAV